MPVVPGEIARLTAEDPTLRHAREAAATTESPHTHTQCRSLFLLEAFTSVQTRWRGQSQPLRGQLIYLAHNLPLAGHQALDRTVARLLQRFYWPGIRAQVAKYCAACAECQMTQPKGPSGGLLQPLALVSVPFERIAVDLVGPLIPSTVQQHFILVVIDYATRYLEAMPLHTASAEAVAHELAILFARVDKQIVTDQGTVFMGKTIRVQAYRYCIQQYIIPRPMDL